MLLGLLFLNHKFIEEEIRMNGFLRFFRKKNYWDCFVGSGLKVIFLCLAQSRILSRSLFSIFAVSSGSKTIEDKDVSSANNFTFDFRPAAKSFINIRKTRGPKIDPCGTPPCIPSQSEIFPSGVFLWTLSLRKPLINPSRFPLTLFCFNLNNRSSYHTLSKAFYLSENTLRVSKKD